MKKRHIPLLRAYRFSCPTAKSRHLTAQHPRRHAAFLTLFIQLHPYNISKNSVPLQRLSERDIIPLFFASWCNGSTTDSGSVCLGSSPSEATKKRGFDIRSNPLFFAQSAAHHLPDSPPHIIIITNIHHKTNTHFQLLPSYINSQLIYRHLSSRQLSSSQPPAILSQGY